MTDARALLGRLWDGLDRWEASFPPVAPHPAAAVDTARLDAAAEAFLARLTAPATPATPEAPGTPATTSAH